MSPILVRPVREQLEHDRIIRLLHGKFRRKYEAGMNPGAEQNEIETGESVNHLEALAQWAHYGRVRAAFHLYVPSGMVDVARRLTEDNQIHVAEIWSYHVVGEEPRFTLVHRNREAISPQARATPVARAAAKPQATVAAAPARAPKAKPAKVSKPKVKAKSKPAPKLKKAAPKKKKK